jgi:hypothetical protein
VHAELRYPAGLDVQLSGLGIEACTATTLETSGIGACPPDSVMGEGQAIAEFLIAHHIVREVASLTAVRTTEHEGHLTMLLYVYDETAVSAQLILTSQLLPAGRPFAVTLGFADGSQASAGRRVPVPGIGDATTLAPATRFGRFEPGVPGNRPPKVGARTLPGHPSSATPTLSSTGARTYLPATLRCTTHDARRTTQECDYSVPRLRWK